MPSFYQRTFGWKPADVALLNSGVSLFGVTLFLYIAVRMMNYYERTGSHTGPYPGVDHLAYYRVAGFLDRSACQQPVAVLGAVFVFNHDRRFGRARRKMSPCKASRPGQLRGKLTALYLLIFSVVGVSIGPMVTALITDLVLHDELQIKWAIFLSTAVFSPISLIIFLTGVKPYAKEVERVKVLEAQAG